LESPKKSLKNKRVTKKAKIDLRGRRFAVRYKKEKAILKDCKAVSEIIGEMLLTAIVVLLISSIAVFVYANLGVRDVPHTEIMERVDLTTGTIEILHSGGETLDVASIKIILYVNGEKKVFTAASETVEVSSQNKAWKFGDSFTIKNTSISSEDTVALYFVHTDSKQVLHKVQLSDSWKS